jgi:peroxiredoxin
MLPTSSLLIALVIALAPLCQITAQVQDRAMMVHEGRGFRTPENLSYAASTIVDPAGVHPTTAPTIIIRYLGYTCSHCVRQLVYLNTYREHLLSRGIRVIAVSSDSRARWDQLVESQDLDERLFSYLPDADAQIAVRIAAQRVQNDTTFDLHATIVRVGGSITYATYGTEPDMDVARIIGSIPERAQAIPAAIESEFIDRYLKQQPSVTVVAGPNDGIKEPLDLDFNRSALHPRDLWVVTSDKRGHTMTVIHDATAAKPVIVNKKDSRASHFMWRTMSLSMGDNGAMATAQNGEPGDGDVDYMFMGPTLWSSDTGVFASRYQQDDRYLGSHLDMLHQSPFDLGIAHDSANVYWVSDAKYLGISRYDFRDPHEVGGTDHRDGIVRRYVETQIKAGERGRPAHIALDKSSGYLYYIDPGNGAVHCLDTRSGKVADTLPMPASSAENLEEFSSVTNTDQWTVIPSLPRPIGIDVVGTRLLVGDAATARIHVYAIDGKTVTAMGYIQTSAQSLHGIVVGPDQRIWFVDNGAGTVCRLDIGTQNALSASRRVVVCKQQDTVAFTYTNAGLTTYEPTFKTRIWTAATNSWSAWSSLQYGPKIPSNSTELLTAPVRLEDSTTWYIAQITEVDSKGLEGLTATSIIIPNNTRKLIINDERYGTFDIAEAVSQTRRTGYTAITSDLFLEIAAELPYLKTLLWYAGTVGDLSAVDDAVLRSCIDRKIDVMIIGDDPFLLRTDLPQSVPFFREFGASMLGVQIVANDSGLRRYAGVLGDPVTAGMSTIECELPRLNHHRGDKHQPSVLFSVAGGSPMVRNADDSGYVGVRYQRGTYRSIILGINASRFRDGGQRTIILDKGLAWLEGATDEDPKDTIATSVDDSHITASDDLQISAFAHGRTLHWSASNNGLGNITIELYASTGQLITQLYAGSDMQPAGSTDLQHLSSGCYHIIVRSHERVLHRAIIMR